MSGHKPKKARQPNSEFFDPAYAHTSEDPSAVPAFEDSLGIPHKGRKPIKANPVALESFNKSVSPEVLNHQVEVANIAALFAKKAIRPDEIAALRRRMFDVVNTGLGDVEQVLAGKKVWNNVQVRLFSLLTERVIPKMATITLDHKVNRSLDDLSLDELEELALGKRKAGAIDAVVKQGAVAEAEAKAEEDADTRRELKKLGKVSVLAQVEREFVAGKQVKEVPAGVSKKPSTGPDTTPQLPE